MYRRILAAIDRSHASERALDEAIELAQATGARLLLFHAVEDPPADLEANPYAEQYARALKASARQAGEALLEQGRARAAAGGVQVETALQEESALPVPARVVRAAQGFDADLVVMGTHGRHGIERAMLGSNAEGVVRSAPVPVLLVRTP